MLSEKISKMLPLLNEHQKRIYLALESEELGHGGVLAVAEASNISRKTIIKGKKELKDGVLNYSGITASDAAYPTRIRKIGGGRKNITTETPQLLEPVTRGHPETVLKWTCLSTRTLAAALKKKGFPISHTKVGELLKEAGFSMQSNSKQLEGSVHPDRNKQ